MLQSITLVAGDDTTLELFAEAGIDYGEFRYSQDYEQLSGRRTYTFSPLFVEGQIYALRGIVSQPQRILLQQWIGAAEELTVTDNIEDCLFTATVRPEIGYSDRFFVQEGSPLIGSPDPGYHFSFSAGLSVLSLARYQGIDVVDSGIFIEVV